MINVTIRQIIDTPHPMYVTMESAVDSATGVWNLYVHTICNNNDIISNFVQETKYQLFCEPTLDTYRLPT